jgi:pimeloyl-ACP methyl ester carboxylesterase
MPRPKLVRSAIPGPGWLVAALLASTLACHADEQTAPIDLVGGSDAGGGGAGGMGGSGGYPIGGVDVVWEPCSLHDGDDDGLAECATTAMPLVWDDPTSGTFDVRAKRLLAAGQAETQLWLLHGGPGASGTIGFPSRMERLQAAYPEMDVYTLDHRGTGYSGRLGCADQEGPSSPSGTSINASEMPQCLAALQEEWGADLAAISTTHSAIDLAAYIEASREPDQQVLLWGGSYGSYWAHRYLQVAPAQADGVVIEGIAPADATFISYDEDGNRVGQDFFGLCGSDSACNAKLGPDPWQRLGAALDSLGQGHCSSLGLNRRTFSLLLAYVLYYGPANAVAPALVYRLERCESADVDAIASAWDFYFGSGGVWDIASYSLLLQHHITFSEMWDHPDFEGVDLEQYFAELQSSAYVAKNLGASKLALSQDWPAYSDPSYDDQWAQTETPMLMLQGALDPATSVYQAQKLETRFTGTNQHFVVFDQAPHNVTSSTPLTSDWEDHCAQNLFLAFLKDPSGALDQSCVDQVLPIDFAGDPSVSEAVLGTSDFWENTVQSGAPSEPSAAPKRRAELRRRLASLPRPQVDGVLRELAKR